MTKPAEEECSNNARVADLVRGYFSKYGEGKYCDDRFEYALKGEGAFISFQVTSRVEGVMFTASRLIEIREPESGTSDENYLQIFKKSGVGVTSDDISDKFIESCDFFHLKEVGEVAVASAEGLAPTQEASLGH